MSVFSAIFLGLVQGVAEFLPISSSGHLAVLQNVFNVQTGGEGHMFFDVLLHLGTVIAIIVAYWGDILDVIRDTLRLVRERNLPAGENRRDYPGGRLFLMIVIATLPLAVILPVHDALEQLYYKTWFIGIAFILTGCLLFVSDKMPSGRKNERTMRVRDAVIIGICQAIATIPGISRSGSTITAGLATGQDREYAMKFSLLMSIPAVLGANLLSFIKALDEIDWSCMPVYLLGMAVAMVSGYFSIVLLRRIVQRGKFGNFTYYLWGVGAFTLIASLF